MRTQACTNSIRGIERRFINQEYYNVNTHRINRLGAAVIVLAAMAAFAGCASTPPPNDKIAVAQAALSRAEQNGAPEYAPVQLSTARDKLARAQSAQADHKYLPASELAEQANIDAQLAEATADEQKSEKAGAQFDASMQALRRTSLQNANSTN
jgi:hypothetical protein